MRYVANIVVLAVLAYWSVQTATAIIQTSKWKSGRHAGDCMTYCACGQTGSTTARIVFAWPNSEPMRYARSKGHNPGLLHGLYFCIPGPPRQRAKP